MLFCFFRDAFPLHPFQSIQKVEEDLNIFLKRVTDYLLFAPYQFISVSFIEGQTRIPTLIMYYGEMGNI